MVRGAWQVVNGPWGVGGGNGKTGFRRPQVPATNHKPQATSHKPQATGYRPQATGHRLQAMPHPPPFPLPRIEAGLPAETRGPCRKRRQRQGYPQRGQPRATGHGPRAHFQKPPPRPSPRGRKLCLARDAKGVLSATDKIYKPQTAGHAPLFYLPHRGRWRRSRRRGVVCQGVGSRVRVCRESASDVWLMLRPQPPPRPSPWGRERCRAQTANHEPRATPYMPLFPIPRANPRSG